MAFGLTANGFVPKRFEDVVTSLQTKAQVEFGPDINITPDGVVGQFLLTLAPEFTSLWELGEAVYNGFNAPAAEGQQLDDLCALNGITRLAAAPSRVPVEFTGNIGTVISTSMIVSRTSTGDQFQVAEAVTLDDVNCTEFVVDVSTVANTTPYTMTINGEAVSYTSDASATEGEITAGLKANFDTISELTSIATCTDNGDGTVTVSLNANQLYGSTRLTVTVSADLTITKVTNSTSAECTVDGRVYCPAGWIDTIETPIAGLDSIRNRVDAVVGREAETDTELRTRRLVSLKTPAAGTRDALLSAVLNLDGVSAAYLYENVETTTDSDGRPGNTFEMVVDGGDDQEIADTIWAKKPAGIGTTNRGSASGVSVIDSNGDTHLIYFSRPATITMYVRVEYSLFDEEVFPTDGQARIADAVVAYGESLGLGKDIIPKRFFGPIYNAVDGLNDLTVGISTDGVTYTNSKFSIDPFERPSFALARVVVTPE